MYSLTKELPWAYTLYPYGQSYNDNYTARDRDIGSGKIDLPFNLTFMGHRFNTVWVHHAGYITFLPDTKFSINDEWPHPQWPTIDDPIFIAPFYCRIELNNDIYATGELETDFYKDDDYGHVMYRLDTKPLYFTGRKGNFSFKKKNNCCAGMCRDIKIL